LRRPSAGRGGLAAPTSVPDEDLVVPPDRYSVALDRERAAGVPLEQRVDCVRVDDRL
jgi:hypothetical protein